MSPRPKLTMLKPRLATLDPFKARGFKMLGSKTLKQKQESNGRTLALDGAVWRKLRASVLACEPLCRHCTARGLTVAATDVDHRDNDPTNNELVNLQPLCRSCHSLKTMSELHGRDVAMGCDTSGMPLDPNHHWNKPGRAALLRPVGDVAERSPATDDHKPYVKPYFISNRENVA
ncbi:MAG: HNH endonuclease signature motif containing protein [Gallionella sp.]|nr:HNH endonuclease signature motif containing protein [Gallionella sp.]